MFVPGIVVNFRDVRHAKCFRQVGDTSLVAAPYLGIRNEVPSPQCPGSYASDTSFRAIEGDECQMNLITPSTSPVHPGGLARLERVVSTARLSLRLRHRSIRLNISLPAAMAAPRG